jgi:hypothetical protein
VLLQPLEVPNPVPTCDRLDSEDRSLDRVHVRLKAGGCGTLLRSVIMNPALRLCKKKGTVPYYLRMPDPSPDTERTLRNALIAWPELADRITRQLLIVLVFAGLVGPAIRRHNILCPTRRTFAAFASRWSQSFRTVLWRT